MKWETARIKSKLNPLTRELDLDESRKEQMNKNTEGCPIGGVRRGQPITEVELNVV